jgi:acetyl esterase
MVLDTQVASFLHTAKARGGAPNHRLTPTEARATHVASMEWVSRPQEPVGAVSASLVPLDGRDVPIRIYVPADKATPGAILFFHGGGWVVGTLDTFDGICRGLANSCSMTVVSVDYRLAPENPYPAALEDCLGVANWIASGAAAPTVEPGPLVVAGDSAGGNLATSLAIRARDEGGPDLAAQVLVYPITDATMSSTSYQEFAEGYYLTAADMKWFWTQYLGSAGDQPDAGFSPLHATNLAGLPPALVITAEFDPLRDEGEEYARRLQKSGVAVSVHRAAGMIHGFLRFSALLDRVDPTLADIGEFVKSSIER